MKYFWVGMKRFCDWLVAGVLIAIAASFLGCMYPEMPQKNLNKAPKDVVSVALGEYMDASGWVDKSLLATQIDRNLPNDSRALPAFFLQNHLKCENIARDFVCLHEFEWEVHIRDAYAKCDHPDASGKICKVLTRTTLIISTYPAPAVKKIILENH